MSKPNLNQCRLCDKSISHRFNLKILNKYDVKYFECQNCGSLQTEIPYWLEEAYSKSNLSNFDTGVVQRNLNNLVACLLIAKIYNIKNVIDVGGGDGLLCRFLRDYEINCYVKDSYAEPKYAQDFTVPDFKVPDLVVGFEFIEHLPSPKFDLEVLFLHKPKLLLFTTDLWRKQSKEWWYLNPESGQHVFFYSKKALEIIALKYKYKLLICGGYFLFVKHTPPFKNLLAKLFLRAKIIRVLKGFVVLLPAKGVWKDRLVKESKVNSTSKT